MRLMTIVVTCIVMLSPAAAAIAQEKPNFAGKWTQIVDSAAATPARVMTITQDAKTLTIEYTSSRTQNLVKLTYNLDGSPLKQPFLNGEIVTTASWDKQKLVGTLGTPPMAAQMTLSLDGGTLVFETRDPGQTETVKRVYKKQ